VDKRNLILFFLAAGFSVVINTLLFSLLPSFGQRVATRQDLETVIPVNVIRFKRPEPPPPVEDRKEPVRNEKPEKMIPTVNLRLSKKAIPQKLPRELDMPQLSFRINPKLKVGIPVSPPPKEPAIFAPKGPYIQGEVDQIPMPIFKVKPIYPYRARRLNISGKVDVKFLVDENGYVSNIKILKSTPPGIFDDSVLKALPSWRFSPGKVRGHAVSTWVVTTIQFDMEEG